MELLLKSVPVSDGLMYVIGGLRIGLDLTRKPQIAFIDMKDAVQTSNGGKPPVILLSSDNYDPQY